MDMIVPEEMRYAIDHSHQLRHIALGCPHDWFGMKPGDLDESSKKRLIAALSSGFSAWFYPTIILNH